MTDKPKFSVSLFPRFVVGMVLAAVAGFILLGLQSQGMRRHEVAIDLLRTAKQTETALVQDVLKIRFGFTSNYDVLSGELKRQKEVIRQLKEGNDALYGHETAGVDAAIDAYSKALESESSLTERFMTDNTTLGNSLHYFPTLALKLTTGMGAEPSLQSLTPVLNRVLRDTLMYCYTDSDVELQNDVERHRQWLANVPASLPDELQKESRILGQHLEIILQNKKPIDQLVRDLVASPTLKAIQSLEIACEMQRDKEVRQGAIFRILLILLCMGLSVLILFAFIRLRRATADLRQANDTLEQRVQERTQELEASQAKLLQAQKMESLGQLSSSIAHDLNNQLTPVRGYLDMLLSEVKPGDPMHDMLSEVNQAAIRSIEIVRRLLNFSKPSSMKKEIMKLEPLIEEIKKMLPQLVPSSIETHVLVDQDLWSINGNGTELQTVIVNLIVNARDAMPDGGKLTLRVERAYSGSVTVSHGVLAKPCVAVSVVDSGSGMTPEVMRRIFEPFFSTKGRAKGTGLGLSMAFGIAKAHDGWIDVSTEIGKGSSFQLYLPAALDAQALENAVLAAKPETASLPRGSGLILFVDDEERIRTMGKIFLESLGYVLIFAKDGSEALQKYKENQAQITAVVSDMTMPVMNGRQMLKGILEVNPKAVIVLSSGYTEEGTHDELIAAGAADFIQKPYTIQMLADSLYKALAKHPKT